MRMILLICVLTGMASISNAQNNDAKPTPEYYQIFLDEPVEQIQKAVYQSDGIKLKTEISDEGKTIILHDYRGRSTVKLLVKYADGRIEEIIKYSCHIVPYPYPSES